MPLREIAMYHFMEENAVEKTKNRPLKKLREGWGRAAERGDGIWRTG